MGLGIDYRVTLRKPADVAPFLQAALAEAKRRKWKVRRRAKDSPAAAISPHAKSEDILFDFTSGTPREGYTKTSFAPEATHVAIIEFFDALKPHARSIKLDDETGYAKHRDRAKLAEAFGRFDAAMNQLTGAEPSKGGPFIVATADFQAGPDGKVIQVGGTPIAELIKRARALEKARRAQPKRPNKR